MEINSILYENTLEEHLPFGITRQIKSELFKKAGSTIKASEAAESQQQQQQQQQQQDQLENQKVAAN